MSSKILLDKSNLFWGVKKIIATATCWYYKSFNGSRFTNSLLGGNFVKTSWYASIFCEI